MQNQESGHTRIWLIEKELVKICLKFVLAGLRIFLEGQDAFDESESLLKISPLVHLMHSLTFQDELNTFREIGTAKFLRSLELL